MSENLHGLFIRISCQIGKFKQAFYFSHGAARIITGNRHGKRKVIFPLITDNMKTALLNIPFCQTFAVKFKCLRNFFSLKLWIMTLHPWTGGIDNAVDRHLTGAFHGKFTCIIGSLHHFKFQLFHGKLKDGRIAAAVPGCQFL